MLSVHITASDTNDNGSNINSTQSSATRRNSGQTPISNAPTHGYKKSKHEGDTVNKTEVRPHVKKERNEETPLLKIGQTSILNAPKMKTSTCGQKSSKQEGETANKTKVRPKHKKEQDEENPLLKIGHRFYNIEEVERAKELYEQKYFCELWKRDSRTLQSAKKRVPKRVKHAEISLQYYSLKLSCKFGGKAIDSKKVRKRKTNSFRQGCPFEIYLVLSEDGKALEVSNVTLNHNHSPSKELYDHLPRQRCLAKDLRQHGKDVLRLKANSKMFQQEIESTTGHAITLKDIANLKYEDKKKSNSNDIEEVVNYLKTQDGANVDVIVDQEGDFKCLLYQDRYMQNVYSSFPELIMVDATYKLLDLRMPVYIMLAIDGEGLSEIVAIFIVSEETDLVITSAVQSFKKHNPAWSKTVTIFSDKDFNERQAFTKCFPQAKLSLCLFHTLRSFKREVTTEKMGITTDERIRCLEIVTQIVYSNSPAEYDRHVKKLRDTKLQSVIQYYEKNWEPIKEQFVTCFKNSILTFGKPLLIG
jgi:zinc finger SWIM domain-containing protein 3